MLNFLLGGPGFQKLPGEPGNVFLVFGGHALPDKIERSIGSRGIKIDGQIVLGGAGSTVDLNSGDVNGDRQPDFAFNEVGTPDIPGRVYLTYGEKSFVRGDVNFDEKLDLSDAIFILSYLFLGGPPPRCEDAADTNDKGTLDITDAVYLLNHLFLGNAAPPAPYPVEGMDPTEDKQNCLGF